jgi:hypothetical protein
MPSHVSSSDRRGRASGRSRPSGAEVGARPERTPDRHRLLLALREHRLELLVRNRRACGVVRLLADEDPVNWRRRLQPRAVLTTSPETMPSPCALAAKETSASPVFTAMRPSRVDRCEHGKGRANPTLRIVAVRDGAPKTAITAIADELLHRPAERLDRRADAREVRRLDRPHVLRVELLRPGGEADEVDEEDVTIFRSSASAGQTQAAGRAVVAEAGAGGFSWPQLDRSAWEKGRLLGGRSALRARQKTIAARRRPGRRRPPRS